MQPVYDENIIVIVLFKKKYRWYCTEKSLWIMDYLRYYDAYNFQYQRQGRSGLEFVKEVGSFGEFCSSRFRIRLLDRDTAKDFLKKIEKEEVTAGELAYDFMHAETPEQRLALTPSLFVDFDHSVFYSQYTGTTDFMSYLPEGWYAQQGDFSGLLPQDDRYWLE